MLIPCGVAKCDILIENSVEDIRTFFNELPSIFYAFVSFSGILFGWCVYEYVKEIPKEYEVYMQMQLYKEAYDKKRKEKLSNLLVFF